MAPAAHGGINIADDVRVASCVNVEVEQLVGILTTVPSVVHDVRIVVRTTVKD